MFQLKCEQYWPEIGQDVMHGCISVQNVSSQVFADFTFRVLNVTCKGKIRKVCIEKYRYHEQKVIYVDIILMFYK
jgi:hypothetical protein